MKSQRVGRRSRPATVQRREGPAAEVLRVRESVGAEVSRLSELAAQIGDLAGAHRDLRAAVSRLEERLPYLERELRDSISDVEEVLAVRDTRASNDLKYRHTVRRIRAAVDTTLPGPATVIVVGKADKELLNLQGKTVWRFPQAHDGTYAGHYPACSTAAIAHLNALRSKGAEYLLIPEFSRWWLEYYADFKRHLEESYERLLDEEGACLLFALRRAPVAEDVWSALDDTVAAFQRRYGRDPAILDWNTGLDLATRLPYHAVFSPPPSDSTLPYLDRSVDVVATSSPDAKTNRESDRVAEVAVLSFTRAAGNGNPGPSLSVRWKSEANDVALPATSIVIPCCNAVDFTQACLAALRETLPRDFRGEIIVVDDGSSDQTPAFLRQWRGVERRLKVLRNRTSVGFIRSSNRGAQIAKGDILVFLNNDTIPLPGWLPPLLRLFRDDPKAGAAGGKLIYPDGRLQEAGGAVFQDGSAANFGRDDYNPDLPIYGFLREVDYCSAALFATPRALFQALGGFDKQYEPGYYEDVDYCFKLREKGYRVFYQPESAVVHAEGGTAGTDLSIGMKRYQAVNQGKFKKRWREALKHQPVRPSRLDFGAWHTLAMGCRPNGAPAP